MNKHKGSLIGFEICQKFINFYQKQPKNLPQELIHQLINTSDKSTLRMKANFQPLQHILKDLTPRLIKDPTITDNNQMLCNLASMYCFLNLYDQIWMNYSLGKIIKQIKNTSNYSHNKKRYIELQGLFKIYRAVVELKYEHNKDDFKVIRRCFSGEFKKILNSSQNPSKFYFNLEKIHGFLKFFILDSNRDLQLIEETLKDIQKTFEQWTLTNIMYEDKNFSYSHSASVYQLCLVFNIKLPSQGPYLTFLNKSYKNNLTAKINRQSSMSKQFQNRGQSVFEIRFQKNLIQNGYWFDRNIKIGIHQYDILLKGIQRQQYYPFKSLKIQNFQYLQFKPFQQDQLKRLENNRHIWYRQQIKSFDQKILINLNGPYHFLYGDKQGLIRSQQIKKDVAFHYGYSKFKSIDYKEWERQTPNKRKIKEYLENVIIQPPL